MNSTVNYDTVFALSPAPLIILDLSDEKYCSKRGQRALLKDANPAALELYEASSVGELADSIPTIIGDEGPETLEKLNYLLAEGERRFRVETTNRTVKGDLLHVLLHVTVPDTAEGSPDFRNIMVYPKDITQGKQPWSHEDAVREIRGLKGFQFKPELVDAFLSCENCIADIFHDLPD